MNKQSHQIELYRGPLFSKIIKYTIPILLTNMLALAYNAADIIIVGNFEGTHALSAVGSTGSVINLMVSIFMGVSVGSGILTSRYFASKNNEHLTQTIHCAITFAIIGGIFLAIAGNVFVNQILSITNIPEDISREAGIYLRIYFLGTPFTLIYNFSVAILSAVGDSKRPLYFLIISGIINVILNLIFVIIFKMSVAGVALATVISQSIAMILVLRCLTNQEGAMQLKFSELRIYKSKLIDILKIGIPTALQSAAFSFSNVIFQSSVNTFGSVAIAGNAAASNIENFTIQAMASLGQANTSIASQCIGSGQYKRSDKALYYNLSMAVSIGIILGFFIFIFRSELISVYNNDPKVIVIGAERLMFLAVAQFLAGFMNVIGGHIRGIGFPTLPMIITLIGVCGLRILWIETIFSYYNSLNTLYIVYPVSWGITAFGLLICYVLLRKKLPKEDNPLTE